MRNSTIAWRHYRDSHQLIDKIRALETATASDGERQLTEEGGKWKQAILGQIQADYICESHAYEDVTGGYNRIAAWLEKNIASLQLRREYRGFDFWIPLAWLGMSHGKSIYWLGERLEKGAGGFSVPRDELRDCAIPGGEKVDWLFLNGLLRLADIMDFDDTRTPEILFDHSGMDNDISRIEWLKHRSLREPPRFASGRDDASLTYIGWINEEIEKVNTATAQLQNRLERLRLEQIQPSVARLSQTTIIEVEGIHIDHRFPFTLHKKSRGHPKVTPHSGARTGGDIRES